MKTMAYWTIAFSIVEVSLITAVLMGELSLSNPILLLNSAFLCGQSSMFYLQHVQSERSLWIQGLMAFSVLTLFGFCAALVPMAINSSLILITCVGIACSILNAIYLLLVLDAFWLNWRTSKLT